MAARTGSDYIERLAASTPTVQIHGETITRGIPEHPAFRNLVATYAHLYDLQHDPALRDLLTYESPSTGDRVGTSFMVPRTAEDLLKRREMMSAWARASNGFLGRTGDYLNSCLMALSEAGPWFAQADRAFGDNVARYYEQVREADLLLTHTLIPPQANRSASGSEQLGGQLSAQIVSQDDNGIVVRGARLLATIGPTADELLVFPSTVLKGRPEDAPYSFAFAINCDAPGLRFLCRESADLGRSHFDHPLGSRYEEMDAVVIFDDVQVPFERCFMLGHPDLCNGFYAETSAVHHMTHQVTARTTAKTEYMLGLVSLLTEAIGIESFGHVQENIAEVIVALEGIRAFVRAAEADAKLNPFGVMTPRWEPLNAARNWYPKLYQRFPEILRKLSASGLMALPTEADVTGPAHDDIERYLQSATLTGPERVRLFRLVWDTCISTFAGRQALYEYYFFGDPVRMAGALVSSYDRTPYTQRVQAFLEQDDPRAV
ncbi:MAG TPA: 4-hydroxyphenylacetate 3-monooxygenase, oxygenase component [Solirubrobacteraceae bacterium]|jgi:4-hydroxyphenylacetate 3-monooxygenase|nr:4-hydroxyphenylacetate 3-monooxygenase, oxygenase component [Solirubrobacteraceae bacterium]